MSKLLQINNFAEAGLNTDLLPWDLPPDYLTDIKNIRILGKQLRPLGGYQKWVDLPIGHESGYLMYVNSTSGQYYISAGNDTVYVYDGALWTDIRARTYSIVDKDLWTGCFLTEIPVLNNPSDHPQYWDDQIRTQPLRYLPFSAAGNWQETSESCRLIRSHEQFLIAMDLGTNAYGPIPDGVRWSTPADIGGVPASWDETDTTNVAGITSLGGNGGRIVDGLSLRDSFVIYRENGITVMDRVNGPLVWQFRHMSSAHGIIAAESIVEVKGQHFYIGDGDIIRNDGYTLTSMLHNRLKRSFLVAFDPDNYRNSFSVRNDILSEIWFCIPEKGATYPTLAYIYNWRDDTWTVRDIPETVDAVYGRQEATGGVSWGDFIGTWQVPESQLVWNARQRTPQELKLVGVNTNNPAALNVIDVEPQQIDAGTEFSCIIERLGFPLEGMDQVTTLLRAYPHVQGAGKFFVRLGSMDYPGGPVRWKEAVEFDPTADRKVDIRTTGELHCFRMYADDVRTSWQLSGVDFEYVLAGNR